MENSKFEEKRTFLLALNRISDGVESKFGRQELLSNFEHYIEIGPKVSLSLIWVGLLRCAICSQMSLMRLLDNKVKYTEKIRT